MSSVEIEVKFYLPDAAQTRARILSQGPIRRGRLHEINLRFDRPGGRLREKSILLRLRKDDRIRLTVKLPPEQPGGDFKIHREFETQVASFEGTIQILEALGYEKKQMYEKWRETFVWDRCLLCMDQMPYGDFLEIEGPAEKIRPAAERLGFDWRQRILSNYLEMFETIRRGLSLPNRDLSFENFRGRDYSFKNHLQRFVAG